LRQRGAKNDNLMTDFFFSGGNDEKAL